MKKFSSVLLLLLLLLTSCMKDHTNDSPLMGVTISNVVLNSYETQKVIEVQSAFAGIYARTMDVNTNQEATWLKVTLTKGKITLNLEENTSIKDRQAKVILYMGPNRDNVRNPDLEVEFLVTQKMNDQFDGLQLSELVLSSAAADTIVVLSKTIQKAKVEVQSVEGFDDVNWCSARLNGSNELIVKVNEHKSVGIRQALIRLLPNSKTPADSLTASTAFLVTQQQNTVLDRLEFKELDFDYEASSKVVKTDHQLKNIKAQIIDNETMAAASWCNVIVAGDSLTVKTTTLNTKQERSAQVTLYLPNNGTLIDSTTITYTFNVVQHHNAVFDGMNIPDTTIRHNQTKTVLRLRLKNPMKGIKAKVTDEETNTDANWLSIQAAADSVVMKTSVHKNLKNRSALVTLYYPNNTDISDASTVKTSYRVTQRHNTVFDNFTTTHVQMPSEASNATVVFGSELTDIKSAMTDSATNASPKWLTVKIEGKKVLLTAKANADMTDRKAMVTLYYPNNGTTIGENTVKTSFDVRQSKKEQIVLENKSLTVSYKAQTVEVSVTSNVGFVIHGKSITDQRVTIAGYHIEGTTHKVLLSFKENKIDEVFKDTLHLVSSTNSNVKADLFITQKTNPAITLFEGETPNWNFRKDGGQFQLLVCTLTPNYRVEKKASWISVGNKMRQSMGKYYHLITIQKYTGEGPLRMDTIFVKNDEVTKKFVVSQDKYLYLSETEVTLEVGKTHQLAVTNKTSNPVAWSSTNASVASVSSTGLITAQKRGNAQVKVSIGNYKGISDYSDYCTVKVFDVRDSVLIKRNYGDYVKTNGYVSAECPITISNGYHKTINLQSVKIVGDDGDTVIYPTSPAINNNALSSGKSLVVDFPRITQVYNPKVVITFTVVGGQPYTKEVDY